MITAKQPMMLLSIVFSFVFSFSQAGKVNSTPPSDYTILSLYIFNFTKYVEWPPTSKTMKIGVVGNSTAEENLTKMAKAKSATGNEIIIVNSKNEAELGSCHIIFIPSNNTQLARKLIDSFSTQPILIVTEESDLTRSGASISFKVVSGKLRFQINEESIKSKGLKVSTSLTALAEK